MGFDQHLVVRRGEIWLTRLDPGEGAEVRKTRPAIIVQNDIGNQFSGTTIIVPLTSQAIDKVLPFQARISLKSAHILKESKALCNHLRAVSKERLVRRVATVNEHSMMLVDEALLYSLGLAAES